MPALLPTPPAGAKPFQFPSPDAPLTGTLQQAYGDVTPPDEPQAQPPPKPVAPTAYRTSLKLTPERQREMIDYVTRRIAEVQEEMGLKLDGGVEPTSWMSIRKRNDESYQNDYSWRVRAYSIFERSNLTLGTSMRHTRYMSARIQDDLVGTNPFFSAMGRSPDKAELAKQVEEYVQTAIDNSQVRAGLRHGIKKALVLNEAVMKPAWVVQATPYIGPATVLVDETGEPILTPEKQLYIYENDNFLPNPNVLQPGEDPGDGTPPSQRMSVVLEKDPSFQMTEGQYHYQQFDDLRQTLTVYEGPKATALDYRCFLCPLRVDSVHEADINVHLYQETPLRLEEIYGTASDVGGTYFSSPPTGDQQPKEQQGEHRDIVSTVFVQTKVAETYFRWDADEDGVAEEIFLVLDMDPTRPERAIFYDYLANHFDKRPFEVIPGIEKVDGRWYGRGIFSLNEDDECAIDVQYNRAIVKGSRNSTLRFIRKGAVDEWDNGIPPIFGGDHFYTLNPGFDEKTPPVVTINVAEDVEQAKELMEVAVQAADSKVGAISVKDASQSGLNQSKTATGIVNLQAASDVITKATEQDQSDGIEAVLEQVVKITLGKMDSTVLMLSKDSSELVTLNKDEIRSLPKDVKLTLSRSRSTQMQAASQQAIVIAQGYDQLLQQNPPGAKRMRPLFISQLKALEVNDADEICPEVTDDDIQAWQQRQQAPQEPPKRSISTKYTDLARSEQEQVLQTEGITPAGPEEIAQQEQKKAAEKAAEQMNKHEPPDQQPAGR